MFSAKSVCDAAHRQDFLRATCVLFHLSDDGQLMLAMFSAAFTDRFLE